MNPGKVVLIGHPRCGSGYMAALFKAHDHDVKHEQWGEAGISSWLFAINPTDFKKLKANYSPFGPTRLDDLNMCHIIHYVRDPLNALPSIVGEDTYQDSYYYRKRILQLKYEINLDHYMSLNRAAISFLLWNKMIEEQYPEFVVRVEDALKPIKQYMHNIGWGCRQVTKLPDNTCNSRPKVSVDWGTLRSDLLMALDEWCFEYGYQKLSKRITSKQEHSSINRIPVVQNVKSTFSIHAKSKSTFSIHAKSKSTFSIHAKSKTNI